jgi:hypothetical protein
MHKRNQCQCKLYCRNRSGPSIHFEGSLCHTETSFKLEPPRTTQNTETKKNLKDNDRGGSAVGKTWTEVKATAVNRDCWHSFMDTVNSEAD